ncbi:MAG: PstA family ABC transporter permease, partial [Microcystaceae cyanobacterium]
GQSVAAAGLTLALLILPVVIVTTRESLRAIPSSLREAAYALGSTKWQMIWDHILPYASGSILTGIIIGLSRAIGETAPVITIGALTFIAFLPDSPFQDFPKNLFTWLSAPFTVMPIQMFNWVSRPEPEFEINAAAAGTVLIFMTLGMNALAIYLRYRFRKNIKW